MQYAANATRRHIDLAWIGFGKGDEVGNGFGRECWIDHHDKGGAANARDRDDVANEIKTEIVIKRDVGRIRRCDKEERVAVRSRTQDGLRADIAASAWTVLDDEGLT